MEPVKFKIRGVMRRNQLHFATQLGTRAATFRDRTKFRRNIKHKNVDPE